MGDFFDKPVLSFRTSPKEHVYPPGKNQFNNHNHAWGYDHGVTEDAATIRSMTIGNLDENKTHLNGDRHGYLDTTSKLIGSHRKPLSGHTSILLEGPFLDVSNHL
jgi:hypothetical protein